MNAPQKSQQHTAAKQDPAKDMVPDLEILIPVRNEEWRLEPVVRSLADLLPELPLRATLRVIDNGSSDRTVDCVDRLAASGVPVTVTGCSRLGKGAAVARGVVTSRARWTGCCDVAAPLSADGLDEAFREALALLRRGNHVVIGSRVQARRPLARRPGHSDFRLLIRRACGPVADAGCGLTFFDTHATLPVFTDLRAASGRLFDLEVIARSRALGLRVAEFPLPWAGVLLPRARPVADSARAVAGLWRLRQSLSHRPAAPGPSPGLPPAPTGAGKPLGEPR